MILHLASETPAVIRGAAALALVLHIGGGVVAMASGTVALLARKGGPWHRTGGNLFFVSILTMAAIGGYVALFLTQRTSVIAGVFAFYLTATGWVAARRRDGEIGEFELGALFVALAVVVADLTFGWQALNNPQGLLDGLPAAPNFVFAAVALLALSLDARMVLHRGLSGRERLARHIWRMCAALFIVVSSFFLGQQQVLPKAWQGSPVLFVPELVVLALMAYWLVRMGSARRSRMSGPSRQGMRAVTPVGFRPRELA
jgi:hypothetical protein